MTGPAAKQTISSDKQKTIRQTIMGDNTKETAWRTAITVVGLLVAIIGYGIRDKLNTIDEKQDANAALALEAKEKAEANSGRIVKLEGTVEDITNVAERIEHVADRLAATVATHVQRSDIHESPETKKNRLLAVLTEYLKDKVPPPEVLQSLKALEHAIERNQNKIDKHDEQFLRFTQVLTRLEALIVSSEKKKG